MRSTILWAVVVAVAIAFGVAVAACSSSPGPVSDPSLVWDQGSWDSTNWN